MRVIIFDLDQTLASTEACHAYLRTSTGRNDIVAALQARTVEVSFYEPALVALFNSLHAIQNCCVAVVSDSPKDYCLQILAQGGYLINESLVFGSQSKPLVDQAVISDTIARRFGVDVSDLKFLVVGDSPKDVYYAHHIGAPSILARWGSKQANMARYSHPTEWADTAQDLNGYIARFLNGELQFVLYNFPGHYLTVSPISEDFIRVELSDNQVGFGKEYVKNKDDYRDQNDKWASNDLRWVVKQAKNLSAAEHNARIGIPLYGSNGLYSASPFRDKAWHFKNDFIKWCGLNNVTGNVMLVPVPPSVPRECNLTHSMSLMCDWWKYWINAGDHKINLQVHDAFERYWPKVPSHLSTGKREMDEQFDTLGVFESYRDKVENVNFVVIVDDVVTSGSHMNAIASFIRTAALVNADAVILGYALFKTVRIDPVEDIDFGWIDAL